MRFLVIGLLGILPLAAKTSPHASSSHTRKNRSSHIRMEFQRLHPCPSTGKITGACPGYVKDHITALCAGGRDAVKNMQWQTVEEARLKDRQERREMPVKAIYD